MLIEDKMLQKTSICFDVSAWELFWTFTVGAQLIVTSDDDDNLVVVHADDNIDGLVPQTEVAFRSSLQQLRFGIDDRIERRRRGNCGQP